MASATRRRSASACSTPSPRWAATVQEGSEGSLLVTGVDGKWKTPSAGVTLDLGNAGTAARFLAASAMLSPAAITIDGNERMRERPIGELGQVLSKLGCTVTYANKPGFPPLLITPPATPLPAPPLVEIPTTQSSQFISQAS